jgi:cbb3-type cytochrome oxidase subunit 3
MRRLRFHIGTLVILVLFLGVGFAALRESNEIWDSSIFTITLCMLLISILLAIHRTERRRAYWLGFTLFGWTYLGLSLVPSIEPKLITTKALAYLDSEVPDRSTVHLRRVWDTWSNNPTQKNQSILSTSIAFSPQENGAVGSN